MEIQNKNESVKIQFWYYKRIWLQICIFVNNDQKKYNETIFMKLFEMELWKFNFEIYDIKTESWRYTTSKFHTNEISIELHSLFVLFFPTQYSYAKQFNPTSPNHATMKRNESVKIQCWYHNSIGLQICIFVNNEYTRKWKYQRMYEQKQEYTRNKICLIFIRNHSKWNL